MNRGLRVLGLAGLLAGIGASQASAGPSPFLCQQALSHPNGLKSNNIYQPDAADYGLRLDVGGQVNTFHFVDVEMCFFAPSPPTDDNTVYATLVGQIAHLQSSDGVTLGYDTPSDYDAATDQLWRMEAAFRVIGRTGTFGGGAPVPYAGMLADMITAGLGGGRITMSLYDLTIAPKFDEMTEASVYTGARDFDEKPGTEANPDPDAFYIEYRNRLTHPLFSGSEWDVNAGTGWLEPDPDNPTGDMSTRDLLFYLVPEPMTLMLLALGLPLLRSTRR